MICDGDDDVFYLKTSSSLFVLAETTNSLPIYTHLGTPYL